MKKIFTVLITLVLIVCLTGCYELNDKYFSLDDLIFDTKNSNSGDTAAPMSVIELYISSKYDSYSIYECKKTDNNKIIAGYLDMETIKLLDSMDDYFSDPLDRICVISGIDRYLKKYQYAVINGKINKNEYPVKCKYVSKEDLSLTYKEQRLVFVLEEYTITSKNILNEEYNEFKVYDTVYGNIKNGIFHYNLSQNSKTIFEHFLLGNTKMNKYYMESMLEYCSLIIYEDLYVTSCTYEIEGYIYTEEYYQTVENTIISEEPESIYNVYYKYDYKEIIKILKENKML